ncbi:MAG: alpha/beta fold hydrolase [bacterium]|nr:alpha/beta fold hydrolase [bacterium]
MIPYMQGAHPYFYPGCRVGCLVIHGLGASPAESRWMGEHLAREGFTVCGVRLAGHGTVYDALSRVQWEDWVASAIDGYHLLHTTCDQVVVIGHSMGGSTALALATDARFPLAALCVLAAPIHIENETIRRAHLLKEEEPYRDVVDRSPFVEYIQAQQIERGEPPLGRVRYDVWAMAALAELVEMTDYTYARLDSITVPTLLLYARQDATVPLAQMTYILERIRSNPLETHILEQSGHIIPQDVEQETAFGIVAAFVRRHTISAEQGA